MNTACSGYSESHTITFAVTLVAAGMVLAVIEKQAYYSISNVCETMRKFLYNSLHERSDLTWLRYSMH